ncbi:unnamed protein product [Chilo suppressalis]|uniref:Uncharacterized protein n=1 Tax=Chilo suppressalis TaxID=168631 RepID=A0ABN8B8J0_CHISP|nr:unnamed protein product [Chilo suppressalis]
MEFLLFLSLATDKAGIRTSFECGYTIKSFRSRIKLINFERCRTKADALARRMGERRIVKEYAEVSRPEIGTDMRVSGLDGSLTLDEVREAVAMKGGCSTREVTVGELRSGPGGMGGTIVRCPA